MTLPEHFVSAGITHDIGRIILLAHLPDTHRAVITHMRSHPEWDFYESELSLRYEGKTHAELGGYFLDL
jgi:hypothetical protein